MLFSVSNIYTKARHSYVIWCCEPCCNFKLKHPESTKKYHFHIKNFPRPLSSGEGTPVPAPNFSRCQRRSSRRRRSTLSLRILWAPFHLSGLHLCSECYPSRVSGVISELLTSEIKILSDSSRKSTEPELHNMGHMENWRSARRQTLMSTTVHHMHTDCSIASSSGLLERFFSWCNLDLRATNHSTEPHYFRLARDTKLRPRYRRSCFTTECIASVSNGVAGLGLLRGLKFSVWIATLTTFEHAATVRWLRGQMHWK